MTATSYHGTLLAAVRRFNELQNPDGGWGLRPGSASSIVNTSQVLAISHAAKVDYSAPEVRSAIRYLIAAIPEHLRLRERGGRGLNVRFLTYGLLGLTEYRQHARRASDAIEYCRRRLSDNELPGGGWPETLWKARGGAPQWGISVFQTSCALEALNRIEPRSDAGSRAVSALLDGQLAGGGWPHVRHLTRPSVSQTALAVLGLCTFAGEERVDYGISQGQKWLLANRSKWERSTEEDPDVLGTAWLHMVFSLGLRACLAAGTDPLDERLRPALAFLDELWSEEDQMWRDGRSDGVASTRGCYAVVMGYEQLRRSLEQGDVLELFKRTSVQRASEGARQSVTLRLATPSHLKFTDASGQMVSVKLTPARWRVVEQLISVSKPAKDSGYPSVSKTALCKATSQASASLSKAVSRINSDVKAQTSGFIAKLIDGSQGDYRLSVDIEPG